MLHHRPLILRATLLGLIFASFTMLGCETITEIDLPEEKPKLVINAIFNTDSLMKVNVTESKPVNNTSLKFKPVENAIIEVFENSKSQGFLEYKGNGNYRSLEKRTFEPDAKYSIKVKATGFETAEAVEAIPGKPILTSFTVTPNYENSNIAYKSYKSALTLNDASGENYYFLRIWLLHPENFRSPVNFKLNNNLGQISAPFISAAEMVLFGDKTLSNKSVTLDLEIVQAYIPREGDYRMLIEVGSICKSYYDYQFLVKKQLEEDPVFNSGESPVSNNIKNGLGIFAPYSVSTVSFDVVR